MEPNCEPTGIFARRNLTESHLEFPSKRPRFEKVSCLTRWEISRRLTNISDDVCTYSPPLSRIIAEWKRANGAMVRQEPPSTDNIVATKRRSLHFALPQSALVPENRKTGRISSDACMLWYRANLCNAEPINRVLLPRRYKELSCSW